MRAWWGDQEALLAFPLRVVCGRGLSILPPLAPRCQHEVHRPRARSRGGAVRGGQEAGSQVGATPRYGTVDEVPVGRARMARRPSTTRADLRFERGNTGSGDDPEIPSRRGRPPPSRSSAASSSTGADPMSLNRPGAASSNVVRDRRCAPAVRVATPASGNSSPRRNQRRRNRPPCRLRLRERCPPGAVENGRRIAVHDRTIITPAGRDLRERHGGCRQA